MKTIAQRTLILKAIIIATISAVVFGILFIFGGACAYASSAEATAEASVKERIIEISSDSLESDEGKDVRDIFIFMKYEGGSLVLVSDKMTITFDEETVNKIAGQDVSLRLTELTDNLSVYNVENAQIAFDISLLGVGIEGGNIKISIPIKDEILDPNEVKVYYVNGEENTDMHATYADGNVTFETSHFSLFVVSYEKPYSPFAWVTTEIIVGIATGILFLIIVILFIALKSQKPKRENSVSSVDITPRQTAQTIANEPSDVISEKGVAYNENFAAAQNKPTFYDEIKAHVYALEGVEVNETESSYEAVFKRNALVKLVFEADGNYAVFNLTDKERRDLPVGVKESTSVLKVKDEAAVTRIIGIIDKKYYKSLSERT